MLRKNWHNRVILLCPPRGLSLSKKDTAKTPCTSREFNVQESHSVIGIHQLSENRLYQVSAVIIVGFQWKDGHLSTERETLPVCSNFQRQFNKPYCFSRRVMRVIMTWCGVSMWQRVGTSDYRLLFKSFLEFLHRCLRKKRNKAFSRCT